MTASRGPSPVAAIVERGDMVDAWHTASVAVIDGAGKLVAAYGDPELSCAARSAIKPFQALALIESGAFGELGVTDDELAIACASHSGTDGHVKVVRSLLARSGARASDLACGAHLPFDLRERGVLPTAGEHEDPLYHNCSGKHAGFLAVARHLGESFADYLAPSSGTQTLVKRGVARACELTESELASGVDGCSAPNYALGLRALATGMLALAREESEGSALGRVRAAMQRFPWLVSGEGRLDNDLMRAFPENLVCKSGAEGLLALGFRDPALGIAIKVHDGAQRAVAPICLAVLAELGLELPATLAHRRSPVVRNYRGTVTGRIRAVLELRR